MKNKAYRTLFLILLSVLTFHCRSAEGVVYLTKERALHLAFPEAERIETRRIVINKERKKRIEEGAHAPLLFSRKEVYLGMVKSKPVGYAFIHDVKGKSLPITFLLVIDPQGSVRRVEILAYRESHGGEIRYPHFLKQFLGKTSADPVRNQRDIRNISGATISCRAVADGVRTLLVLWNEYYGKEETP